MRPPAKLIRQLERQLEKECKLHEASLEIIRQERSFITRFNVEKLRELTAKRARYGEEIRIAHEERLELMKQFPNSTGKRLSVLIEENCSLREQSHLLKQVERLRSLVRQGRKESIEFNHVANFALNVVNGSLSILWQATQNVTKSYGSKGSLKESYNPKRDRSDRVLKEA